MKYTCLCCGYLTLDEEPPGTYNICGICFWEDDDVQYNDPNYEGGANVPSLRQAQQNFIKFVRKPNQEDIKDPNWKPESE
ncbi:CPCC family cysteine-rich protein [Oceanobacillus chungangensis]|uniref:Cysteine-rich CPCC domain-containing protein n=1 Tax=Oceanobacillus chungangensis TaxID=1229152 RepID=A0A3D8PRW3_9BACI|nr:CPCC family cysteine-rich protein [Oceanobacillus chungangensis]RDW17715.1 hypothetical protein CWR45_10275 [Oceanobacillus chungangensis]